MKKGIKLLLSAAFALSIVGCAGNSSSDEKTIKVARRPAADAVGHALQSGGPRLRRARFEGVQVRSAPVHRSLSLIHI